MLYKLELGTEAPIEGGALRIYFYDIGYSNFKRLEMSDQAAYLMVLYCPHRRSRGLVQEIKNGVLGRNLGIRHPRISLPLVE
jgi:hypothetical protein